jgi:type II secretory pathway pseudopilin PulG
MTRSPRRRTDERGETLAEMVVAIAILGIAVVALVAGLAGAISSSSVHRSHTNADAAVRNAAECVKNRTTAYDSTGSYSSCAPGVSISTKWWTGGSPAAFSSTQNANGLEQVTISATSGRATQSVTILKRQT